MNFLEETREDIKRVGHNIQDIMFIGSYDGKYRMTFQEFERIGDFEYYNSNSYGGTEIPTDLIVYFKDDTYLYRIDDDGREHWSYNIIRKFDNNKKYETFDTDIINLGYEDIDDIEFEVKDSEHKIEDILFIGSDDGKRRTTFKELKENYDKKKYINIPKNTIIYFNDNSYLYRDITYYGSFWEYNPNIMCKEEDEYEKITLRRNIRGVYSVKERIR